MARILLPADYGIVAIVTVFITICDALLTGGFGNALVYKKNASDIDFNSVCWISIALSIVLYGLLFFSAPYIATFYNDEILVPVLRVMGLKIIFSAFNSVQQAFVQKKMIFKKFFFATLGGTLLSGVVGVGMAYAGAGVWAIVGQYMINTIVDTVILFLTISWKPKLQISWQSIKNLWSFGSKMIASTLVYTLKDNIRSLVIGKEFTNSDLAFYNQGKKYPQLLVVDIVDSLGKVLFPVFSDKQDDRATIKAYMRKSIRISSYVLMPLIIGLYAVADNFILVLLTEKWMPSVPFLRIMCLVYLTRSMSTVFQKCLLAIGKSNINLIHEIITSILTIVLIFVAAFWLHSVDLVAWSFVVVTVIGLIIFGIPVRVYFRYPIYEMCKDYFPSLTLSVIMGIVVYGIGRVSMDAFLVLVIQVISGAIIYVLLSFVFKLDGFNTILGMISSIIKRRHKANETKTNSLN